MPGYRADTFFVVRAPLCPLDQVLALTPPRDGDDEAALAAQARIVRARLRAIVARAEVQEAIAVASPSLAAALPRWLAATDRDPADHAVTSYVYRLSTRPTPFGLFAGWALGAITHADATRLALDERATWRRHTRVDGGALAALVDALRADPTIAPTARYRPNETLYRIGEHLRYVALGRDRRPHLASVAADEPVAAALERATRGATLDELARAVTDDPAELDDARAFVAQLVEAEVILPELRVAVTGDEPLRDLIAQLGDGPRREPLARAARGIAALDQRPLGAPRAAYADLARDVAPTAEAPERLFHVDLELRGRALALGADTIAEILDAVTALHRLGLGYQPDDLAGFQRAFVARYGARAVPILEVFDPEIGLDYPFVPEARDVPILAGLGLGRSRADAATFTPIHGALLAQVVDALRDDRRAIDVTALARDATARDPLPDAFAATVTLLADGDGPPRVHLKQARGPSGAIMLARFAHGSDALTAHLRAHLRREEALRPDAVFAEVAHLPEGRLANVVARPALRDHEIVFHARSGVDQARQIHLADLRVAVRGDRLVLLSERLGREIVPRLSAAHGFGRPENIVVYHFLGALQRQGCAWNLAWEWGPLAGAPYLPRVTHGRTILAPAQWRVDAAALRTLDAATPAATFRAAQALRASHRLPRFVAIVDEDRVMAIDLDSVVSVEAFADRVRALASVTLCELLHDQHPPALTGPDGRYAHELIVPFVRDGAPAPAAATTPASAAHRSIPGSEWLYVKAYTQPRSAVRVLAQLAPHLRAAEAAGAIDRWFFLHETDPGFHLRLRVHGDPRALLDLHAARLAPALERLIAAGAVSRVQLDTYERELARYGGAVGVDVAEQLFHVDSAIAAELAPLVLEGDPAHEWLYAAIGLHRLLAASRWDDQGRHDLTAAIARRYHREHGGDDHLLHQLGDVHRAHGTTFAAWLDRAADDPLAQRAHAAWDRAAPRVAAILDALYAAHARGAIAAELDTLFASYLHLGACRRLPRALRETELVIHDFLRRYYRSKVARARRRGGP